ncbi:MAG: ATP-binding cassette domain-containing protein [Gallionella sp.]|jgi:branched-chain amino acid transport system ATP-binding protein|nr:ATP-binding cassette domain-containing protein [Gallionella sp.]
MTDSHPLEIRGVRKRFGGLQVLDNLDLTVPADEGNSVAILGQNGAGKTTLLNIVTRLLDADSGHVTINGRDVLAMKPSQLARIGVGRTFQAPRLLLDHSVIDNVLLGSIAKASWSQGVSKGHVDAARLALETVGLWQFATSDASTLSFGSRKLVDLARALAGQPRLLLLDEPAAGLSSVEESALAGILQAIAESGVTLVLVEHRMQLVKRVAHRIVFMSAGAVLFDGSVDDAMLSDVVREGYLGTAAHSELDRDRLENP